jgi:uncharacterized membrane protein YcaP (DUF421 family)
MTIERNANLFANFAVVGVLPTGKLKFVSGYYKEATANALMAQLRQENIEEPRKIDYTVMTMTEFLTIRPEMAPEGTGPLVTGNEE